MAALLCLALGGAWAPALPTASAGENAKPMVFGVVLPLTGGFELSGAPILAGMNVRVSELNRAGGVLGRPVELRVIDDESDNAKAAAAVKTLADDPEILAILGPHNSGEFKAMREPAMENKIPVIAPKATQDGLTHDNPWLFRIIFNNGFQGVAMARFLTKERGFNRLAIYADLRAPYTLSLADNFREAVKDIGAEIVYDGGFDKGFSDGRTDFRADLAAIRDKKPDAVFMPAYPDDVQALVRQAAEVGLDAVLCGGDSWDIDMVFLGSGHRLAGSYFVAAFAVDEDSDRVRDFVEAMNRVGVEYPESFSALGYDVVSVAAITAERAKDNLTRDGFREALHTIQNVMLVTGDTSITNEGEALKSLYIMEAVLTGEGTFTSKTVARIDP